MSLDIVGLHKAIDQWAAEERKKEEAAAAGAVAAPASPTTEPNATPAEAGKVEEETKSLPEGKKVVRTKTSGDRVYMIDTINKTRQWVTTPEILTALGFSLNDVGEMEEMDFLKYTMGPAIYKIPDAKPNA